MYTLHFRPHASTVIGLVGNVHRGLKPSSRWFDIQNCAIILLEESLMKHFGQGILSFVENVKG